jgi:hypothetical protein
MELTPEQIVREIWFQTIGLPADLFKKRPYIQPVTTDNKASTAEQLKTFINENGSAAKISTQ